MPVNHVCICLKAGPFGFKGHDGQTHWRCLEHRGIEVSDKIKLEAYQKSAVEGALKSFFVKAGNLDLIDTPIREMNKVQALRMIAAAVTSYETSLGRIFDNRGAHDETPPFDESAKQAPKCKECGGNEWIYAKRSPKNKNLIGAGCKKCSRVTWIHSHEVGHYGVEL